MELLKTLKQLSRRKPESDPRAEAIKRRCVYLTERLEEIRAAYDMAEDSDLLDALIYEENAVLCRLAALYKEARADGVTIGIYDRQ